MLDIIKKRRSIRKYKDKPIEDEKINEILKSAMLSPTAMNRKSWEFIVVKNKEKIEKLSKTTIWSGFAKNAPLVIVLCADEKKDKRWIEDLSIAGAYIYLEVVNQGLGTCWIEIREGKTLLKVSAEEYVKNILAIPASFRVLCMMPIGYKGEAKDEHSEDIDMSKIHKNVF